MSAAASGNVEPRTLGYVVKSTQHGRFFQQLGTGYYWTDNEPTVYPSVRDAVTAIIRDQRQNNNGYDTLTILKAVETRRTVVSTAFVAL